MSKKQSVGVAFLGFGRMGETHLRNLAAIAGVNVVVVADERAERADLGKAMSGAEVATTNQVEAINHSSVDAVVISTPTDTHARLIELASKAGKAVFSEKPIALDLAETQRVRTDREGAKGPGATRVHATLRSRLRESEGHD